MLKYDKFLQALSKNLKVNKASPNVIKEIVLKALQPSFSGFGEDLPLFHLLQRARGLHPGFYVDIGAFDPIVHSNTYLLHLLGWRGLNVDANHKMIKAFSRMRPSDINIHAGVADRDEMRNFYEVGVGLASSFDEKWAQDIAAKHKVNVHSEQQVQCYNVNTLLAEHLPANTPIDVLDIDIEGYDEKVLSVLDWEKYRPLIVLVETHTDGIDELITSHTYQLLTKHGYRLAYYFSPTTMFLRA